MMKKIIGLIFCIAAFVYTVWYMHFGVPYQNSGALSKIGINHHTYFVIWGILTLVALFYNIIIAFKRYTNTKVYIPLLAVCIVGMVLTLSFNFDYSKKLDYYLHCAGSLTFSAVMGVTIFLLFLICYKQSIMFKIFTYLSTAILIVDLICLIIFKETALIEALPIFAGYVLLTITNFRRDKVEAKR